MPRIRKKTSNRGTTHDRKKIQQKVAETHKKNKKKAKKDVTWRSNKRVDPGIPNNFPYKDEVLAELAEQRAQLEAERLALKGRSKAALKAARDAGEEDEDESEGEPEARPGVKLLAGSRANALPKPVKMAKDDSPPPLLFDSSIPTLQAALEKADVWLEVVDARDPLGGRSPWLEQLFETPAEGEKTARGKVVVVLTKIDLVPREALDQWLQYLRPRFPTVLFKSFVPRSNVVPPPASAAAAVASSSSSSASTSAMGFAHDEVVGRETLLAYLSSLATAKKASAPSDDNDFTVTLAGLPSAGKTSVLNSLLSPAGQTGLPISAYPQKSNQTRPTTTTPTSTTLALPDGVQLTLVDTPGWTFEDVFPEDVELDTGTELEEEEAEALWEIVDTNHVKDLLRRNLGRLDKVKEAMPVAEYIIAHASPTDLQLLYSTAVHDASEPLSFLIAFARATGRLKRGAEPDLDGSARALLRDWSMGFLPRYTLPPKGLTLDPRRPVADLSTLSALTEGEAEVLARARSRREMMRSEAGGRGLVKMTLDEDFVEEGGDVRAVVLDDEVREQSASDSDEDDEMDEDDEEWTDDGEDEDEDAEMDAAAEADDFAEGEVEDEDDSAPSALDVLLAANPTLVQGAGGNKPKKAAAASAAAPAPAPVSAAAAAPAPVAGKKGKKAVAAGAVEKEPKRKVVFAGEKPATTPSRTPKAPVSILKAGAPAAAAPPAAAGKKGKKQAPVAAAAPAPAPAAAAALAVGVPSKKEQREKKRKASTVEDVSATPAAPVKAPKKAKPAAAAIVAPTAKKAAVAPAAAPAPVKSKASDRASAKGEVAYSFDSHFF